MRVAPSIPVNIATVIQSESGQVFMLGHHGDASRMFRTFRLFEADKQYSWKRRTKSVDAITGLPKDGDLETVGLVWGAYEPSPEMFDRQFRVTFEGGRFITNAEVQRDDLIDERKVSRADVQLGLRLLQLG